MASKFKYGDTSDSFQLRLMFEHEMNGLDEDDEDHAPSLEHTLFDRDFLAPEAPKRPLPSRATEVNAPKNPLQAQAQQKLQDK